MADLGNFCPNHLPSKQNCLNGLFYSQKKFQNVLLNCELWKIFALILLPRHSSKIAGLSLKNIILNAIVCSYEN